MDIEERPIQIALPSIQSILIEAIWRGEKLGTGTGFVVLHDGSPFLITNYHVIAGRHPETGQPNDRRGIVPDSVRLFLTRKGLPGQILWRPHLEPVITGEPDSGDEEALWYVHPNWGRRVDVVALPLTNVPDAGWHPYDLADPGRMRLRAAASDGVNIIGFPFGRSGGLYFAIWTRGFVASEPDFDIDGKPFFYIDARTRPGQSGSPVIAFSHGGATQMDSGGTAFFPNPTTNLLGVYSGRIDKDSDIGIVWKVKAIRQILEGNIRGVIGLTNPQDATRVGWPIEVGLDDGS